MTVKHTKKIAVISRRNISQQLFNVLCGEYVRFADTSGSFEHLFTVSEMFPALDEYPDSIENEMGKLIETCEDVGAEYVMFEP